MTDLRKAAEMALDALELERTDDNGNKVDLVIPAIEALRQALAQWDTSDMAYRPNGLSFEQEHESRITSLEIRVAKLEKPMTEHEKQLLAGQRSLLRTAPPSKQEQEKESTAQTVDPRVLLGRSNNFTKETENRLCDIERRLAVIETQPAPPSKSEQEPEKEKEPAATSIHYPDCWDTACYPTLQDAIKEIGSFKCTNDDCSQPEQEPVAWMLGDEVYKTKQCRFFCRNPGEEIPGQIPLYTAPPSKPWVSLSVEEIKEGAKYSWVDYQAFQSVAWWADEKLKEKNT